MEYAVFETGGKQYKVAPGEVIQIEKVSQKQDDELLFDKVLLYVSDGKIKVGTPYLKDARVLAKVLKHEKGEKIRVGKFKAKARYRKVHGHRQDLTSIKIEKILLSVEKLEKIKTEKSRPKKKLLTSVKS